MLIEATALSKKYSTQTVFSDLNLQVHSQEFLTILGPSGCGKSTLLKIIAGLELPSSGILKTESTLSKSVVFQEPRLLPWLDAVENAAVPLTLQNKSDLAKVKATLESLGLGNAELKFPHQLSGGMKMRVSIARALVSNPDLILCDEPFSALDEDTRLGLQVLLRDLFEREKKTLIFVTHSLEEACFLSDRILIFTANGLKQFVPDLPKNRTADLKNQVQFFNEVQRLRQAK